MVSIRVSVTIPKWKFKDKKWVQGVADALVKKTAPHLKVLFRKSTYGWSKHPSFKQHLTRHAHELAMEVYTEDEKYGLVNAGSPKHVIGAARYGFLRFKPGYRSATTPGQLQSRRAFRSGKHVTSYGVNHPGFEARKFDELVAKEYEPQFRSDIQDALNRAAKPW